MIQLTQNEVGILTIVICLLIAILPFIYSKIKQSRCKHERCEKVCSYTIYNPELKATHGVAIKCLKCSKIIQVEQ
jgi:hypothetical protein